MKKQSIALAAALALCCSLICSPARAKTFVGVLWPMFGPFLAVGLVELVAEIKLMPNVEVKTYLHQNWPSLVEDINRQPKGTRTLVVGYSLGANATVFVANKVDYIDSIIALQPSMLSWNPDLTGKVGKIVEIYNPKPERTFGGMGSKKLSGENIEYIANDDTHLGTQFSTVFRNLVKSEIARLALEGDPAAVQAEPSQRANASTLVPEPRSATPVPERPNDVHAIDAAQTADQPHCHAMTSEHADRAESDGETGQVTDAPRLELPHYGSLVWRAAAQDKTPHQPMAQAGGGAPCSE